MKKIIYTLLLIATLTSCSKSKDLERPNSSEPNAQAVSWSQGINESVIFKVTFANTDNVTRVSLYQVPSVLKDYENNPVAGQVYTMYDNTSHYYPTWASSIFYQFEFTMKDGSKVMGEPFQVY